MIHTLEKEFQGIGEVKGFNFVQIKSTQAAYMYSVESNGQIHYEVFKRKNTPLCIDFKARLYSDIEFKEVYPKSKAFGIWAWTIKDYDKAVDLLCNIELKEDN